MSYSTENLSNSISLVGRFFQFESHERRRRPHKVCVGRMAVAADDNVGCHCGFGACTLALPPFALLFAVVGFALCMSSPTLSLTDAPNLITYLLGLCVNCRVRALVLHRPHCSWFLPVLSLGHSLFSVHLFNFHGE